MLKSVGCAMYIGFTSTRSTRDNLCMNSVNFTTWAEFRGREIVVVSMPKWHRRMLLILRDKPATTGD